MRKTITVVGIVLLAVCAGAQAQQWSAEQLEVWNVITEQWEKSKENDNSWIDSMLHPSFLAWGNDNPMPRSKASTARWTAYTSPLSKTHEQELHPVGIVLAGSTAVAHYYFTTATEDNDGERETTHGRYSDVLTKTADGWKFVAWSGGGAPSSDD